MNANAADAANTFAFCLTRLFFHRLLHTGPGFPQVSKEPFGLAVRVLYRPDVSQQQCQSTLGFY